MTYRSSCHCEGTNWSVSNSWILSWWRFHDPTCGVVDEQCPENRLGLEYTTPGLQRSVRTEAIKDLDAYNLTATNFRVIWDVAYCILAPYQQVVVVRLELAGNKLCPCIECL